MRVDDVVTLLASFAKNGDSSLEVLKLGAIAGKIEDINRMSRGMQLLDLPHHKCPVPFHPGVWVHCGNDQNLEIPFDGSHTFKVLPLGLLRSSQRLSFDCLRCHFHPARQSFTAPGSALPRTCE